jgi:hypothetical protein
MRGSLVFSLSLKVYIFILFTLLGQRQNGYLGWAADKKTIRG